MNLEPVIYTIKTILVTLGSGESVNVETVAKRIQMLTAIFNRQDLGQPGLLDQTWFRLDRFPLAKTDPIGTFEKNVTHDDEPYIKWLYDNIKFFN